MEAQTSIATINPIEDNHRASEVPASHASTAQEAVVTVRKPHRILHFSDGTWEENSDDDEPDGNVRNEETAVIDPKTLTWLPWFAYQAWYMGSKSLEVCDYVGEKLAAFFGITTPKYQYVIDEYNRMIEQEKQAKKQMDLEMGGWTNANPVEAVDAQPKAVQPPNSAPISAQ